MKIRKYFVTFIVMLFVSASLYAQDVRELTILHWNDFHARNMPYEISRKKDGQQITYYVGGSASMLGYLNKYRDDHSLVLNAGDDYQGTPISSLTKGFSQIKLLNSFKLDAFTIGNHDFDYGEYTLDSALRLANFDYLAGNLYLTTENKTFGKPYVVKEINGIKIGILGESPKDLKTLTLPKNVTDIVVLNTDSVINVSVGELKKEGCNLIVMLSHNGYDEDSVFATRHPDLNIIIGGHSHTPIFKPREVNGVLICQAGSYGRYLGKLDIKFDISDNKITYHYGKLIETVFDSTIYDKSQQQLVENMEQEIKPLLDEVIGTLQTDWKAHGKFGSNLAQWQADIFRQKVNADIGCINTGGVRRDLLKGNITVGDIWEINPFGNTINIIRVNGKMLREMLTNHLVNAYSRQEGKSGTPDLLVFSGLKITVNSSLPVNASSGFIQSLEVNGKPIDDNKEYTLSTNNYVAAQIEKFFGKLSAPYTAEETNIIDRDAFIEAVKAQKNINSVQEERVIDLNKK